VQMQMTHVIRGEDLLPSTPRQLEIVRALGADPPHYAHLPLIVGPDRQPLSKRHGAVAVEWFKEQGYLPEALVNYLALLGWSYDETTTILDRERLIERFDLAHVSRNPAAFDTDKLTWMNGHYIREASDARLTEQLMEVLFAEGLAGEADLRTIRAAVPLVRERMRTVVEGAGLIRFLFVDDLKPDEKAQRMLGPERVDLLREAASRLEAIEDWTHEEIETVLRKLQVDLELTPKQAFQPVRAAVTGTLVSPPLFESIELLGRERSLARIRAAVAAAA
jgi:glutamyl-tRNA synthetase